MTLSAIIAWIMANPQIIALGETAVSNAVAWVTQTWNLHQQGVLTDAQLAGIWSAMGVNVTTADKAWTDALAAHNASKGTA